MAKEEAGHVHGPGCGHPAHGEPGHVHDEGCSHSHPDEGCGCHEHKHEHSHGHATGAGEGHVHGPGCGHADHGEPGHIHDESCSHGKAGSGKPFDLLILNIGAIATPKGESALSGSAQAAVEIRRDAWIGIKDGKIAEIGGMKDGRGKAEDFADDILDATGLLVTPGLIDAHTHLAFGGWRHKELALKLKGVPYLEILRNGGGILSTVRATRAASLDQLVEKGLWVLDQMLAHGTTTVEAKSGYGLTVEDELKQLEAIAIMAENHDVGIVPTLMGAHAVPEEYIDNREAYIRLIVDEMIPKAAASGLAAYCDAFCEKGAFTPDETRAVLEAARAYGLGIKVHADEIHDTGGAKLASEMGAASAEHLIKANDEGLQLMAERGTIAVLLPCTSFYLGEDFARARLMIELGIPVAIATDFNPGSSPNLNLQMAMTLGCLRYRMSPEEVLTAVTLNAAAAIGMAGEAGSIEPGKAADLVIWEAPDLDYLLYRYGSNMASIVVKGGKVHGGDHGQSH